VKKSPFADGDGELKGEIGQNVGLWRKTGKNGSDELSFRTDGASRGHESEEPMRGWFPPAAGAAAVDDRGGCCLMATQSLFQGGGGGDTPVLKKKDMAKKKREPIGRGKNSKRETLSRKESRGKEGRRKKQTEENI